MNKKEKVQFVIEKLEELYPKTPVPLNHKDPYTLLIAVLLSAQCTDERVNLITPKLFVKADSPEKMIKLSIKEIVFIQNNLQNLKWKYWHRKNLWYKYKTRQHLHALWHKYNSQKPRSIKTFTTFEKHVNEIIDAWGWYLPIAQRKKMRAETGGGLSRYKH